MVTSRFFVGMLGNTSGVRCEITQDVPRPTFTLPRSICVKEFRRFSLHSYSNRLNSLTQE
jgi:hypothetical protein